MEPTDKQKEKLALIAQQKEKLAQKQERLEQRIRNGEVRGESIHAIQNQYDAELAFIHNEESRLLNHIQYGIDE